MTPLLHAWLRRLAASPMADEWVVRGGLVTCHDVPKRAAPEDIDLVGRGDFDAARAADELARVTATAPALADGVRFDAETMTTEVIWGDTPFPGLRAHVPVVDPNGHAAQVRIDLGYGDPLDPGPRRLSIGGADVLAVSTETMIAWKVHGLVEHGRGRWRAKDLADAVLLLRLPTLDLDALTRATRLAFESRGAALDELVPLLADPTWGGSRGSRRKWRVLLARRSPGLDADLFVARDELRRLFASTARAVGLPIGPE